MQTTARAVTALTLCLLPPLAGLIVGCNREEPISTYQAPKDNTAVVTSAVGPASVQAPPRPTSGELTWTAPAAWKEEPAGGQMRFATYLVNENPKVEFTVVPLGGEAGAVLPNINRWEGQLGLPPSPQDKLGDVAKQQDINGLQATLVDLTGPASANPRQRMLAAIVPHADRVWFFKLVGPVDVVSAQKANFDSFMQSLKPGAAPAGGEAMAGAPTTGPAAGNAASGNAASGNAAAPAPMMPGMPALPPTASNLKLAKWNAPADWHEEPNPSGPRAVAFQIGPQDKQAELIVTHFPEGGAGDFLSNVNRWRNQIGLEPVQDPKTIDMKDVPIGSNGQGVLLEFSNPAQSKRMTVAIGSIGGELWFYKLVGQADTVAAQRQPFESFLKSVQFGPAGK